MDDNKSSNSSGINPVIFVILFIIAMVFEFYWIINYPYEYFMLFGIGIVALIFAALSFEGIAISYRRAQKERAEQTEMLIKTQKALYLATKKNNSVADLRAEQNIEAIKYLVTKMTDNQKEIAALIKENSATNQNRIGTDQSSDLGNIVEQITLSNARLAKEVQTAITVNELVKTNADLVKNVKEVLNQTIANANHSMEEESVPKAEGVAFTKMPQVEPEGFAVAEPEAPAEEEVYAELEEFAAAEPEAPMAEEVYTEPEFVSVEAEPEVSVVEETYAEQFEAIEPEVPAAEETYAGEVVDIPENEGIDQLLDRIASYTDSEGQAQDPDKTYETLEDFNIQQLLDNLEFNGTEVETPDTEQSIAEDSEAYITENEEAEHTVEDMMLESEPYMPEEDMEEEQADESEAYMSETNIEEDSETAVDMSIDGLLDNMDLFGMAEAEEDTQAEEIVEEETAGELFANPGSSNDGVLSPEEIAALFAKL